MIELKILFCQPSMGRSGSEMSLRELARGARGMVDCHLLAGDRGSALNEIGSHFTEVSVVSAPKLARDYRSIWPFLKSFFTVYKKIKALNRAQNFDYIYVNTLMFPQAIVAAWLNRIPCLTHVREVATTYPLPVYLTYLGFARIYSRALVIVCHAIRSQKRLLFSDWLFKTSYVVYNTSSYASSLNVRSLKDPINLLSVIPVTQKKGVVDLIQAFVRLNEFGKSRYHLNIVGRIDQVEVFEHLQHLINSNGFQNLIEFHGERSDVSAFYKSADILIHPSHTEALPRVLIEAGNFSLPCVTTDVGGASEIVIDGVNGYVVPVGDIDAIAKAVVRISSDAERYALFSRGSYKRYNDVFSPAVIAKQWFEHVSKL